MFEIKKTLEICGAHRLELNYPSKCERLHGHNWMVDIYCRSEELDKHGMVVDFTEIKKLIDDRIDHFYLNEVEGVGFEVVAGSVVSPAHTRVVKNPTAERLAKWICMLIDKCYRVDVQESRDNVATYTDDSVRRN